MRIKTSLFVLCCSLFLLLWSCNDSNESITDQVVAGDAQITSFALSTDSIYNLASTVFVIDHAAGTINNPDSMSFGTQLSHKAKATYSIQTGATLKLKGDTQATASLDTLDITGAMPIELEVTSPNGLVKKTYSLQINVHQLDPDSIHYSRIASDLEILDAEETKAMLLNGVYYLFSKRSDAIMLHQSNNLIAWDAINELNGLPNDVDITHLYSGGNTLIAFNPSGDLYISYDVYNWQKVNSEYPVQATLGYLGESQSQASGFSFLVNKDDKSTFAFTTNFSSWTYGETIPNNFPIREFSSVSYLSMNKERISLFGGSHDGVLLNTVWSTLDGHHWAKINTDVMAFPAIAGANAFLYDETLYLMNGYFGENDFNRSTYCSVDGGNTWTSGDEKTFIPFDYDSRYNASCIMGSNQIFYFFVGGKNLENVTDIWQGHKNELIFENKD